MCQKKRHFLVRERTIKKKRCYITIYVQQAGGHVQARRVPGGPVAVQGAADVPGGAGQRPHERRGHRIALRDQGALCKS